MSGTGEQSSGLEQTIAEIKSRRAHADVVNVEEEKKLLVIFRSGAELFAFEGASVKEILPRKTINPVPGCPAAFMGVINMRGVIESVADMHAAMGDAGRGESSKQKIIMLESGAMRTGILVDSVEDVLEIAVSSIKEVTVQHEREFFSGETFFREKLVSIIDADLFLNNLIKQH